MSKPNTPAVRKMHLSYEAAVAAKQIMDERDALRAEVKALTTSSQALNEQVAEVEALEKESRELRGLLDREKTRTRLLKEDLLAANNETGRLLDLMSVIRKAAKMARA